MKFHKKNLRNNIAYIYKASFIYKIVFFFRKLKWRRVNQHNFTSISNRFPFSNVNVGKGTYGDLYILINNMNYSCSIGSYCSIGPDVKFLVSSDHHLERISTYPFEMMFNRTHNVDSKSKGNIVVDDDVWIGAGAIILSGVHIYQGAVVAAGAVVIEDVPAYAIVGGIPARIIKKRFADSLIEKLLKIDFSLLNRDFIINNISLLYTDRIDEESIAQLYEILSNNQMRNRLQ